MKFSIEFWCKVNSNTGDFAFVNKGGGGGNEQYSIDIFGSNLRYYVKAEGGGPFTHILVPRITVAEGWVHIAATFNHANGIMKLYKNGVEIVSTSPPSSLNNNTNPFTLGVQAAPLNQFLNGKMDEVRIWNSDRTQTQLQNNMNCEIPTTALGLVANYHFNHGVASGTNTGVISLTDVSGNGNNGTLNGFALIGATSNSVTTGGVTTGSSCTPEASTINIKIIPEGLYNGNKRNMKDTVRTYLHNNISPYNVVDSAIAKIDSVTFQGTFNFVNAPSGTYYIRIKHRNTIETWSGLGGEPFIAGSTMNYDFTDAVNKAYENNMKQVDTSPVRFGVYSGDVNQDGYVDVLDLGLVYNDVQNSFSGYVNTDVNGDDFVDVIIFYFILLKACVFRNSLFF